MLKTITRIGLGLAALVITQGAQAQDCGLPPDNVPTLPDGDPVDRTGLMAAIDEVKKYSADVNAYLDCMDARKELLFIHLTEAQRGRWNAETDAILEKLASIEVGMNEQIQKYNARITDDNESDS